MAYDSALVLNSTAAPLPRFEPRSDFRRLERIGVFAGASAIGALLGVIAAIAVGRLELWIVVLMAAPFLVGALHLTAVTLREGFRTDARGCSVASIMHVGALLAWPMTSLFIPLGSLNFFIAPVLAMSTLLLLASCWGGASRAVYRIGAQGALVAVVAAHQGMLVIMG